jgi:hypothetical protein
MLCVLRTTGVKGWARNLLKVSPPVHVYSVVTMFHATCCLRYWIRSIALSLALLVASTDLRASAIHSSDLDSLVKQSWAIAQVTVDSLQTFSTGMPESSPIATRVNFVIQKVYKGKISGNVATDFLGGTVGNRRMSIPRIPQFKQGQRLIVFLANPADRFLSGTIGRDQGVLRIVFDSQTDSDRVYRWWGQGVNAQTSFQDRTPVSMETTTSPTGNAETLSEFETQLVQAIAQTQ